MSCDSGRYSVPSIQMGLAALKSAAILWKHFQDVP